jgi:hypothetical protein
MYVLASQPCQGSSQTLTEGMDNGDIGHVLSCWSSEQAIRRRKEEAQLAIDQLLLVQVRISSKIQLAEGHTLYTRAAHLLTIYQESFKSYHRPGASYASDSNLDHTLPTLQRGTANKDCKGVEDCASRDSFPASKVGAQRLPFEKMKAHFGKRKKLTALKIRKRRDETYEKVNLIVERSDVVHPCEWVILKELPRKNPPQRSPYAKKPHCKAAYQQTQDDAQGKAKKEVNAASTRKYYNRVSIQCLTIDAAFCSNGLGSLVRLLYIQSIGGVWRRLGR